jgi:hypothetical protein
MFFSFPLIGIAAHAAKHTGVIAGLDPAIHDPGPAMEVLRKAAICYAT